MLRIFPALSVSTARRRFPSQHPARGQAPTDPPFLKTPRD
jgi:hypothetical protein